MFYASLLSALFVALAVSADPIATIRAAPISLQLSRNLNATNFRNLYQHDLDRVKALKVRGTGKAANEFISTPAVNRGLGYVTAVGVGSPPTSYTLVVDTGSALTWVGANKQYVKTKSGTPTTSRVSVKYASEAVFTGTLYTDTVTFGVGLAVQKQLIGVTSNVTGFPNVDGILGLGPVGLTARLVRSGVPTVTDSLFAARLIPANMMAISFQPTTYRGTAGQLTWGGVDRSNFKGSITYVPVTTTSPASKYWGINQKVTYGNWFGQVILPDAAGVVDTGTTLVLIASDAFVRYRTITGATPDPVTKLLMITPAGFAKMKSLYFKIGPTNFEFTPNAQIWPRTLNTAMGGSVSNIYLIVCDIGENAGQGMDFVNGYSWLQRFYSVYDTTNKRIGIANTPFTTVNSN